MAKEGLALEITELRLGLPGDNYSEISVCGSSKKKKRVLSDMMTSSALDTENENSVVSSVEDESLPVVKSQAVGWPPVCSYRRKKNNEEASKAIGYVKVSMDGVPYMRKIDLGSSNSYINLVTVLENLFGCLGIGVAKEGKKCEYIIIYEDKDRDWMLVGDVPWQMFKESCKRLRIVKRSDATGFGLQQD
ncbi:Auxin-responsive protein IAA6 [Arabidopsis thaliana]|uniref:Auxin-responsive protein IAA6 n=12 Tax=Arabidopsis TaxID=3701 RepID=IAA6_ARATH|nr:indole-3-acetic acid 6 [Arabidopsis thaliana]Q38824.2 RecName: Full=Auxin-responsive protein IAA6; AltName: Full=Indoleacetic acid-induced protein 6 [Arabidopsis thaliana]KAG7649418.1 PB1 domain [Arabidopsis thaliana x Arabidopsis arenosa]KAG7657298.1 PB1 domain [Arabidopsis suecica]AAG52268.1 putative IAA6 protein; 42631-41742 [Arabidopsis thaliana]AAG53996.1 IAA6 [Arabidopsis thaliana]AEE32858.1 indole-3-acetic acid 6 [Arabidopsis thaliana]|eukprot:NP_175692.1 indole-3-acetic acid 6 [Arabidopsis thaliana]